MAKKSPKHQYICTQCSYTTTQWQGKCPECNQWNTLQLTHSASENILSSKPQALSTSRISSLADIATESLVQRRYQFSTPALTEFFSGGLAHDSLTLLAGEPGLGKSTFSLQLLKSLLFHQAVSALYVTAEESLEEVAKRAKRLGVPDSLILVQSQNYENIEKILIEKKPQVVILDSIQTIFSTVSDSAPGSVAQVTNIVTQLLALCKSLTIAMCIIGHVTKEGAIAGPRTLEHLVDAVLLLERNQNELLTLNFQKNRFGSTEQLLFLKMQEGGLSIITDPSLLLLENLEKGVGIVYALMRVKNQTVVVEIQALVSQNSSGVGYQKQGIGITAAKLHSLLAIAKKYLFLEIDSYDVYINIVGMPKGMVDESLDLPILLAILSSYYNKPIHTLLSLSNNKKPVFAGRITLSGSIRVATSNTQRQKTAQKLKMEYNPAIQNGDIQNALATTLTH